MEISLIHLEHAMPPLAELGLEHLVPVLLGGGRVELDADSVAALLHGLADGAKKRASRRLVAISRASAEELFNWESNPEARNIAEKAAALLTWSEAKDSILGFFSSLGISPEGFQPSSGTGEQTDPPLAGTPTPE
jgi:hypothetical protein